MGRKLLIGENPSVHPIVSLSLLIAFMAAIVTLISSLCVSRKKSPPHSASQRKTTENPEVANSPQNEATTTTTTDTTMEPEPPSATHIAKDVATQPQTGEEPQLPLPPPPGMTHLRAASSCHYRMSSSASESKLLSSMSMRVQGGGGMGSRQQSRREEQQHEKKRGDKKLKHEDSIWKKTIILGEKCRVPDEDDTILYDEKGNRISTYHPKNPGSLPMSRQSSYIDPDAIPSSAGQK
ncbi:Phosphatidylinositol 3,4,5-trisphosphate 5-phosphatase [Actinidia chinensis var. chinensis]|uniref:Phosphatidylinositol 3,4,5-trisphosphate 5-phosphatase n=1 Tax=Actinidia chinensis var. chinensis TaxID=1590841 RepID=A0A2R6Q322_ACTCC|nr:Phosphatidylinositol 3,4,5-trisphosphate 5-phosphatase [Actinidia chinensis var. chinensis]